MGLGLVLTGRYNGGLLTRKTAPEDWLHRVEAWARANCADTLSSSWQGRDDEGHPTLCLHFHPSAEPVDVIATGRGRVLISAKTSTTGPGYHIYLCDLLRRLGGDLGVTWNPPSARNESGDETGYFYTGDRSALEMQMLQWLQSLAQIMRPKAGDGRNPCMCNLPLDHRYEGEGAVLTPMGPRDAAWLQAVAEDPRRGVDFFPWWREGTGAPYHLGRALCQMWTQVRWRPPLIDEEADLLAGLAGHLEAAFRLDPALDYPWREWQEILGYLQTGSSLAAEVAEQAAQQPNGPRIGYRRRNVAVELAGGWSIRVPGSFAECWEENGTWDGWDQKRSVYVTAMSFAAPGDRPSAEESLAKAPLPEEGELLEHRGKDILGRAALKRGTMENPNDWLLTAASAAPGALALITLCYEDPADRQWAIETWHSLAHRSKQPA